MEFFFLLMQQEQVMQQQVGLTPLHGILTVILHQGIEV